MPNFSFTYNGYYNPLDTVTLSQDGSADSSGPNDNHSFGPLGGSWFIFNNSSSLGDGGKFFIDANRMDGERIGYTITGTEYSVSADMSDNTASVYLEGGSFGDILRSGSGADTLKGGSGNDVLEGGAGADTIEGGLGIDTASYEHAPGGVYVSLDSQAGQVGDATGDVLSGIENLIGSNFIDVLAGDDNNNTINGNGGPDNISGLGGNDRIVVAATPFYISGGDDKDVLIVVGGGTVSLTDGRYSGIEAVYVRNDARLDMTNVLAGSKIVSQSTSDHDVRIVGTSGNDTIKAGKGGDTIDGGTGSDRLYAGTGGDTIDGGIGGDKLFAGMGADSFRFEAGFGRDNLYGLDLNADHIVVDIAGVDATDILLRPMNGGRDTLVTFGGVEAGNKIILHDMNVTTVEAAQNELFLFGA